jgi:hypothetical protein
MKDMKKDEFSMDISGGDESETQIVSYKRWKTTQPTIRLSATKRFTTLVPCTQEAYLVNSYLAHKWCRSPKSIVKIQRCC